MYGSAREVWSGFSKNLFEGLGSLAVLALALGLHLVCFLAPYLVLLVSWAMPEHSALSGLLASWTPFAAVGVAQNVLIRGLLALRHKQPWEGILLHPLSIGVLLLIALHSTILSYRGALPWANRIYEKRSVRVATQPEKSGAGALPAPTAARSEVTS
jgi:chlorobactene glucosyltransferase